MFELKKKWNLKVGIATCCCMFLLINILHAQQDKVNTRPTFKLNAEQTNQLLLRNSNNNNNKQFGSNCGKMSAIFKDVLQHKEYYIPNNYNNAASIPKIVKLRFVIADPGLGVGYNFSKNDKAVFEKIVENLNGLFSATQAPTKPHRDICGDCHIPDIGIRFQLAGVGYYNTSPFLPFKEPDQSAEMIGADSVLHIFCAYFPPDKNGYAGITNPKGKSSIRAFDFNSVYQNDYITVRNIYQRYQDNDLWGASVMIMHELFHEYSMNHLWSSSECSNQLDYLTDIFGPYDSKSCPQKGDWANCDPSSLGYENLTCDNNVMAIRGYNYTSPMQIGIIHRESFMGRMRHYTFPILPPSKRPWVIDDNQAWDFPMRMYQDIIVERGVTFTVKCTIEMPPQSRIILKPGAQLIVDGGLIKPYYSNYSWGGVEVVPLSKRLQKKWTEGKVVILNDGSVL